MRLSGRLVLASSVLLLILIASVMAGVFYKPIHPPMNDSCAIGCLLFNESGLKTLRIKFESKELENFTLSFNRKSHAYLMEEDDFAQAFPDLKHAEELTARIEYLAFMYLMTENTTYAKKSAELLRRIASWKDWAGSGLRNKDLVVAFLIRATSIGYDWLQTYLNQEDKKALLNVLKSNAQWIYDNSIQEKYYWSTAYSINHYAITHAALGLAGLTLEGSYAGADTWVAYAEKKLQSYLDVGEQYDGLGEGLHYFRYGLMPILIFADALRNKTGHDLYNHPFLHDALYLPLYALSPSRNGYVNFGDALYSKLHVARMATLMIKFASEYHNEYAQWYATVTEPWNEAGLDLGPWNIIWYDLTVTPMQPDDLPLDREFSGIGWAIMRTGWTANTTLFAFKSGPWWNHAHADQNSFILEVDGARLAIDLGAGPRSPGYSPVGQFKFSKDDYHLTSLGHNTVLVNGSGQNIEWPQIPDKHKGGALEGFLSLPHYAYVLGNASGVYNKPLEVFWREVFFVKPDVILIMDRLSTGQTSSKFDWLLHTADNITYEDKEAVIKDRNARARLLILAPSSFTHEIRYDQKTDYASNETAPYLSIQTIKPQAQIEFNTAFYLGQGEARIEGIHTKDLTGLGVQDGENSKIVLVKQARAPASYGGLTFDAKLVAFSNDSSQLPRSYILQDGNLLRWKGLSLFSSDVPASLDFEFSQNELDGVIIASANAHVAIFLNEHPSSIVVNGKTLAKGEYSYDDRTKILGMSLSPGTHHIIANLQRSSPGAPSVRGNDSAGNSNPDLTEDSSIESSRLSLVEVWARHASCARLERQTRK